MIEESEIGSIDWIGFPFESSILNCFPKFYRFAVAALRHGFHLRSMTVFAPLGGVFVISGRNDWVCNASESRQLKKGLLPHAEKVGSVSFWGSPEGQISPKSMEFLPTSRHKVKGRRWVQLKAVLEA